MPLTTERIARVGGGPDAVTRHDSCPHIRAALERQPAVPLGNVTACWAVHTHASARLSQDMALHGWSTRPRGGTATGTERVARRFQFWRERGFVGEILFMN